ncbi:MAG: response regulator [Terrimesophilobacter sp.]
MSIRTLVVEDDFRVAQIHADRVSRVDGFECVGTVQTAAKAREAIAELSPDLVLLDIYLPDEDGLSLLKSIQTLENAPDCIVITAARDLGSVRTAMRRGAIYYLVKPFGFDHFRRELEAYRYWKKQLDQGGAVDQAAIDELYGSRSARQPGAGRSRLPATMKQVLDTVTASTHPIGAAEVAVTTGMSRPTAQRYLTSLERQGLVELRLEYGSTGRPVNSYVARHHV